ncbi:MAG TPA: phosphatidylglycerophosphatase A [Chromatiales bacterium]|nr:phosphatidylglycerophosphatase A [Chromatiales bacterium]
MSLLKRNGVDARLLRNPVHFLSLGFGSGLSPFAPGTAGTLAAIPVYWLMAPLALLPYLLVVLAMFVLGVFLCQATTDRLGSHDHSAIVWDEVVGYLLTMFLVPFDWRWVILGFFLFRLFDVWKPWPVRWLDRKVQGGLGIMLDDVGAAVYAALCLQAILYWVNRT